MGEDTHQFESDLDSKIRRYLVKEGYLFPLTDAEFESAMREMERQEIVIPPHLDNPLIFLNPSAQKKEAKIVSIINQQQDDYATNFMALAAREGVGEIPVDVLEQMKKDRDNQPDE